MNSNSQQPFQFHERKMGFWSAASIGLGAMIGAGIFALIGVSVEITGPFVWLAFLFAGLVALLTSYSFSKLALAYPSKGGPVAYFNIAFGKDNFLPGVLNITMLVGYIIVSSLYARAFGEYGTRLFGLDPESLWLNIFISFVVILFVGINFLGASAVGISGVVSVIIQVGVLLLFGIMGMTYSPPKPEMFAFTQIEWGQLLLASGIVFMSYEGFGLVVNTAEDLRHPRKNLPRALYFSVITVIVIYILVTMSVVQNLDTSEILAAKEYALAEAASPIMGSIGFNIMAIAAIFSTASAINATIYGPVYMLEETAEAGQTPRFLTGRLLGHDSGQALTLVGVTILLSANLLDLQSIAEAGSMIFLFVYIALNITNIKLRKATGANLVIPVLATLTTLLSLGTLIYYLISTKSLSIYIVLGILALSYFYQLIRDKSQEAEKDSDLNN